MTNHPNPNSAAQAAEPHTVLSFDERERILCQFMGEPINHDREMAIAIETAVLRKLRAPVADERAAVDPCGYVAVKVSAVDWLKDKFPALTIKAGLCERIGGRLYTITRLMRDHDTALASAPVADLRPHLEWAIRRIRTSLDTGEKYEAAQAALDAAKAAPVAMAHVADERELRAAAQAFLNASKTVVRFAVESLDDRDALVAASVRLRAALASAPVAGEAQPSRQTLLDAIWRHGNARAMAEHNIAYRDEVRNTADALLALFDAAPQASAEDVRNAALEEAARMMEQTGKRIAAGDIRALKQPLADKDASPCTCPSGDGSLRHPCPMHPGVVKDGGQQRAAFDHPVFAFLLGEGQLHGVDFGERAPGAVGKWWWRKDLRAALSATQAEQGERDAG